MPSKFIGTLWERLESRFMPEPNSGCWLWMASLDTHGYAQIMIDRRCRLVHRMIYEIVKGHIPLGLTLDHKCRMRLCVNPAHLEPVTRRVNTLRGLGPAAINIAKTHCKQGHKFDDANTYRTRDRKGRPGRSCRACNLAAVRQYKLRVKRHGDNTEDRK